MPRLATFFKRDTIQNRRWKIQNLKYDSKKGSNPFIFTQIALCAQELEPTTNSMTYYVIYFYQLSRTAVYKKMVRNDDPLNRDSSLLVPVSCKMLSDLPEMFFTRLQSAFNDEMVLATRRDGHVYVSMKIK
jgi:hypothetical protein